MIHVKLGIHLNGILRYRLIYGPALCETWNPPPLETP
jgi:hypothetical protein